MGGCSKQWCIKQFHAIRWRGRSWGVGCTKCTTRLMWFSTTSLFPMLVKGVVRGQVYKQVPMLVRQYPNLTTLDLPRHLIAWNCLIHHCLLHPAIHHHLTNHFIHLHPQQSYLLWPHCSPADFLLNLADMFGVGVSTAVEIIECKFKLLS